MLALACNCIYILCEVVVLVHAWGLIIIILFAFACKHACSCTGDILPAFA
jgi:hypothetical protein